MIPSDLFLKVKALTILYIANNFLASILQKLLSGPDVLPKTTAFMLNTNSFFFFFLICFSFSFPYSSPHLLSGYTNDFLPEKNHTLNNQEIYYLRGVREVKKLKRPLSLEYFNITYLIKIC